MKIFDIVVNLASAIFWAWSAYRYIVAPTTLHPIVLLVACIISGLTFVHFALERMNED